MAKLGTIAANGTSSIRLTYIPEYLTFKIADLTKISQVKLNVFKHGVIVDLPLAGLQALDAMGQIKDDSSVFLLPIANGKFLDTEGELTVTNADAANAIEVFGFGTGKGTHFIKHVGEKYLQGNTFTCSKFLFLAAPSLAANDVINPTFNDEVIDSNGKSVIVEFSEFITREEVQAMSGAFNHQTGYNFVNLNQMYKNVKIQLSADQTFYYSQVMDPNAK